MGVNLFWLDITGNVARFGVSLDTALLAPIDKLAQSQGSTKRSEAIRELIRTALARETWGATGSGSGVLTLLYDHHRHDLSRRLTAIQHDAHDLIITTMHLHIDHYNCLEILALRGDCEKVRELAQRLIACKGVKYGVFNPVPDGKDLN